MASRNICEKMTRSYGFDRLAESFRGNPTYGKTLGGREWRLITVEGELVDEQEVADAFRPELVVFLSRHESRSGRPVLTVHTPGNIGSAEFGGIPGRISVAPANAMRNVLRRMIHWRDALGLERFEVCYEGTHHGPSLDFPTMFAEVGSGPVEWGDSGAAEAVARAVVEGVGDSSAALVALGVGGSHYGSRFTRLAVERNVAFGHIVPSYLFGDLSADMLRQCVERTSEKVQKIVLDWKGIDGKDRDGLLAKLRDVPLEAVRLSSLTEAR